ncbi:MAG: hypothetical protein ACPG7C_07795 [Ilumatobacteraceae bacterium]
MHHQHVHRHTDYMGFNPYRKFSARPSDYLFVASGLLIAGALLVWGIFG